MKVSVAQSRRTFCNPMDRSPPGSSVHKLLQARILEWVAMPLGEGNGTPLQYSCLENPMGRGAWKAAVHGVAEGRTRLSDFTFTFTHWRRKWQPTPVFSPGKSHGQRNLVGYSPWGRKESDTTERYLLYLLYYRERKELNQVEKGPFSTPRVRQ